MSYAKNLWPSQHIKARQWLKQHVQITGCSWRHSCIASIRRHSGHWSRYTQDASVQSSWSAPHLLSMLCCHHVLTIFDCKQPWPVVRLWTLVATRSISVAPSLGAPLLPSLHAFINQMMVRLNYPQMPFSILVMDASACSIRASIYQHAS